jgi:integrase
MAVRQLPDGRWIYYYRDLITQESKREYCGRGPEGEAKARHRDKEANHRPGRPARRHYGPTFEDLAATYYNKRGFDRKPRETLSYRLDGAILPAIGHHAAMSLTESHLDDYVAARRRDGVKDNSIRRELTDIKAILSWAARRRPALIPVNPVRDYKGPPDHNAIILPPEPAELDAIYNNACAHLQRFIALAIYLGCRPGAVELLSLTWSSVSWKSRSIRIISAQKGGPQSRQVPVHANLYQKLEKWYQQDLNRYESEDAKQKKRVAAMSIVHYWGSRVTTIKRAWRSALDGAGITRRIRPYDLRHRFVTTALEHGADIGVLADVVGSRPETLRKYYQHVTTAMHRNLVESLPDIFPKNNT